MERTLLLCYAGIQKPSGESRIDPDRALQRLDEDTERLRLAYNAQRQEEIVEEIEVILLSADLLAGEGRDTVKS